MLEKTVREKWGNITAITFETVLGSLGRIIPEPGWMEHIRKLCDEYGIIMIVYDVKFGFRIARRGIRRAIRDERQFEYLCEANGERISYFSNWRQP